MNQKVIGILGGIFIAIVVIGALGFVYAQQSGSRSNTNPVKGTGFVDLNNDGVCDNAGSYHNTNSTGGCKGKGQSEKNMLGFVDANNNGICDHMESGEARQGNHNPANCPMRNK